MKKSKLVAVKKPSSESKFLRRSTGAQSQSASDGPTDAAANDSHQTPATESTDAVPCPSQAAETQVPAENPFSAPGDSSGVPPSEGEFRFDFDGSECGPDVDGVDEAATSSRGKDVPKNYLAWKPAGEEFHFNFTPDEGDRDT